MNELFGFAFGSFSLISADRHIMRDFLSFCWPINIISSLSYQLFDIHKIHVDGCDSHSLQWTIQYLRSPITHSQLGIEVLCAYRSFIGPPNRQLFMFDEISNAATQVANAIVGHAINED